MSDDIGLLVLDHLDGRRAVAVRGLLNAAFDGDFGDDDWTHALGGTHFLIEGDDGSVLAYASVVERVIRIGDGQFRTGYLEGVATRPADQGRGLGSRVVDAASAHVLGAFELGALSTGRPFFYERLGWEVWHGTSGVRMPDGTRLPTPDDDDGILILRTPSTPPLDRTQPITCEWRPGDVW